MEKSFKKSLFTRFAICGKTRKQRQDSYPDTIHTDNAR
jgi:hypothetical protein